MSLDVEVISSTIVGASATTSTINTNNRNSQEQSSKQSSPGDAQGAKTPLTEDKQKKSAFNVNCVICMDPPVNWTATKCGICHVSVIEALLIEAGHVFCYDCLMQALIAKEHDSRISHGRSVGACPTCRTPIDRNKPGEVIPMLFQVSGAARSIDISDPKGKGSKGKGKERATEKNDKAEREKSVEIVEVGEGDRPRKRRRED